MTQPTRQDFRLFHRLRVRWGEVDLQRIVFNPHYLMYIDTAFTEYWRALAIPYEVIPVLLGGDLYVKKSSLEYHGSARLDDLLDIGVKCDRVGNSSMVFGSGIFRGDSLLVTGELIYVFADPATQTSKRVPLALRELLQSYEAGVTSIDVQLGPWTDLGAQAGALRKQVFTIELQIPLDLEHDTEDLSAVHVLVRNRLGQPLGTGRLSRDGPGVARIARVAVDRAMRGTGVGRAVMHSLMRLAAERGDTRVLLRAQCSAGGFYTRLGYVATGDPFEEAGVPHIDMACNLAPL